MIDLRDPTVVQTEELCMQAVKNNGYALKFVKKQTDAICIEAVKQTGIALTFVHNQTNAICIEAVRENGSTLFLVKNQTEAICTEAVKNRPYALRFVHNRTEAICLEAIENYLSDSSSHTFEEIYNTIEYPSPQLIIKLLKLYPSHTDTIMSTYTIDIMKTYKVCSDAICVYIVRHANDLLYRPNSVNALGRYSMWYRTINNAKTVFLMT